MNNNTGTQNYDYAETPQNMLEFIYKDGSSFAYNYAYLIAWELTNDTQMVFRFSDEKVTIEGSKLSLLKGHISKLRMVYLKESAATCDPSEASSFPVITNITREET